MLSLFHSSLVQMGPVQAVHRGSQAFWFSSFLAQRFYSLGSLELSSFPLFSLGSRSISSLKRHFLLWTSIRHFCLGLLFFSISASFLVEKSKLVLLRILFAGSAGCLKFFPNIFPYIPLSDISVEDVDDILPTKADSVILGSDENLFVLFNAGP